MPDMVRIQVQREDTRLQPVNTIQFQGQRIYHSLDNAEIYENEEVIVAQLRKRPALPANPSLFVYLGFNEHRMLESMDATVWCGLWRWGRAMH